MLEIKSFSYNNASYKNMQKKHPTVRGKIKTPEIQAEGGTFVLYKADQKETLTVIGKDKFVIAFFLYSPLPAPPAPELPVAPDDFPVALPE